MRRGFLALFETMECNRAHWNATWQWINHRSTVTTHESKFAFTSSCITCHICTRAYWLCYQYLSLLHEHSAVSAQCSSVNGVSFASLQQLFSGAHGQWILLLKMKLTLLHLTCRLLPLGLGHLEEVCNDSSPALPTVLYCTVRLVRTKRILQHILSERPQLPLVKLSELVRNTNEFQGKVLHAVGTWKRPPPEHTQ